MENLKQENEAAYEKHKDNMVLRDLLAADRTILANERTFLAYLRTFLSLMVAGISFIKVFQQSFIKVLGFIFIATSIVILIVGVKRYIRINQDLKLLKN